MTSNLVQTKAHTNQIYGAFDKSYRNHCHNVHMYSNQSPLEKRPRGPLKVNTSMQSLPKTQVTDNSPDLKKSLFF